MIEICEDKYNKNPGFPHVIISNGNKLYYTELALREMHKKIGLYLENLDKNKITIDKIKNA